MCNRCVVIEGGTPGFCEVHKVVRDGNLARLEIAVYSANSVCGEDSFDTKRVQGPDACPVVYSMRRNRMVRPVSREENHLFISHFSN